MLNVKDRMFVSLIPIHSSFLSLFFKGPPLFRLMRGLFFRLMRVIYLMDKWNVSSGMPGYHSLGGKKNTKKHKTNCQLFCCFEQLQLNREHSDSPHKFMHRLQVSIPVFISEPLTFPRHLLTFVDTCKQQGVSISKEKQWKENSDGQMSTGYGHLLLWLQHWALKCTVGQCHSGHSGHLCCAAGSSLWSR